MLGITVGWGGGTSTELAYMVVLDLAAKMAVGSRCEIHHRYCGCDLVWCCCLQCLPSQANWFFLSPCWSRLSNDARMKWLSMPLPIFFRWPHLISFDLSWVFAWGIQSSRAWCSSDKARDNAIKDMRFCRWHGVMASWLWNYYCNLLYKHMALWDLWTEQKQWTQGGSKDKTTQVGSSWRIVFSSSTFVAWKAKEYELFFQATIYINRYTKSHSLIPNLYKDQKIDWSLIRFGL